jgi:1,4-alpha-glucan branching enzyme
MGGEFGQRAEWNANGELDWPLLKAGPYHRGLQQFVEDLNRLYLAEPGLWKSDYDAGGFRWIDCLDHLNSVLSFLRQDSEPFSELAVILNLTPVPRPRYRVGLPRAGKWRELLNSDAAIYGGSNLGNFGGVLAEDKTWHSQPCSAEFTLPPLSILVFRPERPPVEIVTGAEAASGHDNQAAASETPALPPGPGFQFPGAPTTEAPLPPGETPAATVRAGGGGKIRAGDGTPETT